MKYGSAFILNIQRPRPNGYFEYIQVSWMAGKTDASARWWRVGVMWLGRVWSAVQYSLTIKGNKVTSFAHRHFHTSYNMAIKLKKICKNPFCMRIFLIYEETLCMFIKIQYTCISSDGNNRFLCSSLMNGNLFLNSGVELVGFIRLFGWPSSYISSLTYMSPNS